MKIIRFDDNYPKLAGQTKARLISIAPIKGCDLLCSHENQLLVEYDTLKSDGTRYEIDLSFNYLWLFLVGDKGILFSTLRKDDQENREKYEGEIGNEFIIRTPVLGRGEHAVL